MLILAFCLMIEPTEADRAISELEQPGYTPEQIPVISKDAKNEAQGHADTDDTLTSAGHGAKDVSIVDMHDETRSDQEKLSPQVGDNIRDNGITFMASDTMVRLDFKPGTNVSVSLNGDNEAGRHST